MAHLAQSEVASQIALLTILSFVATPNQIFFGGRDFDLSVENVIIKKTAGIRFKQRTVSRDGLVEDPNMKASIPV